MKQINHRKVRKSINGGGEGEGVVFGCWKGFNLSHSSGLQSRRRNSANDFHGAKNHLAKIYEEEKKKEEKKKTRHVHAANRITRREIKPRAALTLA